MKLFVVDKGNVKCNGCGWRTDRLYALADSQEEANRLYENEEAGLCGDCIADLLSMSKYDIRRS